MSYGYPYGSLQPYEERQESQNSTLVKAGVALWSVKLVQVWVIKITIRFGVNINPIQWPNMLIIEWVYNYLQTSLAFKIIEKITKALPRPTKSSQLFLRVPANANR